MKTIIAAAVAVAALGGCVAVPAYEPYYSAAPAPYYSAAPAYYYPAPAVSLYYSNRGYYGGGYHRRHW
jgi:hypothetical protein